MTYFHDNWEEQRDREEVVEAVDDWVTREGMRVQASAGLTGPWGPMHPVAWGYCSGRYAASEVAAWRERFETDPAGTAAWIAQSYPGFGPQGPAHIRAAAGVTTSASALAQAPQVEPAPTGPRWHRNAADELRNTHPGLIDAITHDAGPPPNLFAEGDLPRITASGIDPAALRGLPWRARLAAAWEPDRVKAFAITQDYAGPDAEDLAMVEFAGHSAVNRHVSAVNTWANTKPAPPEPTEQEMAAMFPPSHDGPPPADPGSPAD